jgi:hypothetical protein
MKRLLILFWLIPILANSQVTQVSQPTQYNKYVIVLDSLISKNISLPRQTTFPTPKRTGQLVNKLDTIYYYNGSVWVKLSSETDPIFKASEAYGITSTNKSNWTTGYNLSHYHANKVLLDAIKTSDTTRWAQGGTWGNITGTLSNQTDLQNALNAKQATLISGTNIKTVNNTSLLGSGNITIESGGDSTLLKSIYQSHLDTTKLHNQIITKQSVDQNGNINVTGNYLLNGVNLHDVTKDPTGFEYPADVVVNYNSTNRTVTLTGTTTAYYRGKVITALTSGWTSSAHTATSGIWFLYHNGTDFIWSQTAWTFDMIMIASVHYDTDNFALKETHGLMPWQAHKELHEVVGTYSGGGGDLSNYTLNSTTAANRRPHVSAISLFDEDNLTVNPELTTNSYTVMYLTGSGTNTYLTSQADIIPLSTNRPYYNQFTGGAWQQTLMGANTYSNVWLVAVPVTSDTTSQKYRYLWIQGQSNGTLTTIQALTPASMNLGGLTNTLPEMLFIGRLIVNYSGSNWQIVQVDKITGSKSQQTVSPSGLYLTGVTTDATLTGSGTAASPLRAVPELGKQVIDSISSRAALPGTFKISFHKLNNETEPFTPSSNLTLLVDTTSTIAGATNQVPILGGKKISWGKQWTPSDSTNTNRSITTLTGRQYNYLTACYSHANYRRYYFSLLDSSDAVGVPVQLLPPSVSGVSLNATSLRFSWSNITNNSGYTYKVSTDNGSTFGTPIDLATNTTSVDITGLSNSTRRDIQILTKGNGSSYLNSVYSATANATTTNLTTLGTGTLSTPTVISSTEIDLVGSSVANNSGYKWQISRNLGVAYTDLATTSTNTNSYNFTTGHADSIYYFKYKALGDNVTYGDGAYSNAQSATTLGSAPLLTSAYTSTTGDTVHLVFNKIMQTSPSATGLSFSPAKTISSITRHATNSKMYDIVLSSAFAYGNVILLSYTPGTILAADNGILATISGQSVTNNVPQGVNYGTWDLFAGSASWSTPTLSMPNATTSQAVNSTTLSTTGGTGNGQRISFVVSSLTTNADIVLGLNSTYALTAWNSIQIRVHFYKATSTLYYALTGNQLASITVQAGDQLGIELRSNSHIAIVYKRGGVWTDIDTSTGGGTYYPVSGATSVSTGGNISPIIESL